MQTQKIVYANNYGHKNTAALRWAYKKDLLNLEFDRDSTGLNNKKIFKAYSKGSGRLVAEFHMEMKHTDRCIKKHDYDNCFELKPFCICV